MSFHPEMEYAPARFHASARTLPEQGGEFAYTPETQAKFDATVELHKVLGAPVANIPWIPESMRNTPDACKATADKMAALVEKLAVHGLRTGFHAPAGDMHILEKFTRVGNEIRYDITVEDPESFVEPWVMPTRILRPAGGDAAIIAERAHCEAYEQGDVITNQLRH